MNSRSGNDPGLAGLVLAAGRARRMGTLKQTLPWPPATANGTPTGSTIVASAFDTIARWCRCMCVVVGADAPAVTTALGRRAMTIVEADSDAPMFESVCAGIRAIDTAAFAGVDTIVLQPADHPVAAQATMRALLQSHVAQPHLAIMPEHAGRGGHPVLIPLVVAREILHWNGQGGLRRFWVERPSMHRRIPVDDPLCVLDLNTPSDYQAAFTACQQRSAGF